MLRELFRSTLYSSNRPPSRSATRRSSFSTLMTSLLPVLREVRPKIRFTLSIINLESWFDHERVRRTAGHARDQDFYRPLGWGGLRLGGGGGGAAGRDPKSLSKKLGFLGGGVATGCAFTMRCAFGIIFPRASASGSTSGSAVEPESCTFASLGSRFSSSFAAGPVGAASLKVTASIIWNAFGLSA